MNNVGRADLLIALAALKPKTDEEKTAIGEVCGFSYNPKDKKDDHEDNETCRTD